MKSLINISIFIVLILFVFNINKTSTNDGLSGTPFKRFEYKYSLKGPYLAQKDSTVPFWEYNGHAIASDDMVRLVPSLRSRKGAIWSKLQTDFDWWEVELWFRVTGRGRIGADGLAFWYTQTKTNESDSVFGAPDKWVGLGLIFDSFDNDGKRNNPYIMAMLNDGTQAYDHDNDGIQQQISGCLRDFRNKPYPTRAKIEYYNNVLTVYFHSGNTINDNEYELCLRAENVHLPSRGYFGVSAATGGLADDHDLIKFLTYSLHPPGSPIFAKKASQIVDREQLEKQYEGYVDTLDKKQKDYKLTHPDEAAKHEEFKPDQEYEQYGELHYQQILNVQNNIFDAIRSNNRKLDEIIGRQERTLSLVSGLQTGPPTGMHPGGAPPPPSQFGAPIQRHEVDTLLAYQQESVKTLRELQRLSAQPASVQQGGHNLQQQLITEIRDSVNVLRRELGILTQKFNERIQFQQQQQHHQQPQYDFVCLSPFQFYLFMFIHLLIIIGFTYYKSSKDNQAKKFY